ADLFFLTENAGARGLVQYSPKTKKADLLASNRRVPPQNPLDDAALEGFSLTAADGVLQVLVRPAKVGEAGAATSGAQSEPRRLITYDPAKKSWAGPMPESGSVRPKHL